MLVYRFRITFENNDEFLREIELETNQSFLDFYNILAENLLLDRHVQSAFYLCDHKYRKKQVIYHPQSTPAPKGAGNANQSNPDDAPNLIMDKCVLSDYVDDPHQRFLFIYDLTIDWNFYIELMRIPQGDEKYDYPRIARTIGKIPHELVKKVMTVTSATFDEDSELEQIDDLEPEPDEIEDIGFESEEELLISEEVVTIDSEDIDSLGDDQLYDDTMEIDAEFDDGDQ